MLKCLDVSYVQTSVQTATCYTWGGVYLLQPRKKKPFINKKTDNIRTYSLIPKTDSAAEDPEVSFVRRFWVNFGTGVSTL